MPKVISKGRCLLCKATFPKGSMTRHLQKCTRSASAGGKRGKVFHIVVGQPYSGSPYWLHVEVPVASSLFVLDKFLRGIWLECCGHLSAFRLKPARGGPPAFGRGEASKHAKLASILQVTAKLEYEYDFGSTTQLELQVVDEREGPILPRRLVRLLARNEPLAFVCVTCGAPATEVCPQCAWEEDEGLFCKKCLGKHPCGDEMALPVVNSPRMGVCGYTGDAAFEEE